MVFKATFNNISVISRWSVLLVEETEVPGENHQPAASHWQTLLHNAALSSRHPSGVQTHKSKVCSKLFQIPHGDCLHLMFDDQI